MSITDKAFARAYSYALKILSRKDYSEQRVKDKLLNKGYNLNIVCKVIEQLTEHNYINEERNVCNITRARLEYKHWGPYKIKLSLYKMGYKKEIIEKVLNCIEDNEILHFCQEAIKDFLKHHKDDNINKDKLFRFLTQRGFSVDTVMKCFNQNDFWQR